MTKEEIEIYDIKSGRFINGFFTIVSAMCINMVVIHYYYLNLSLLAAIALITVAVIVVGFAYMLIFSMNLATIIGEGKKIGYEKFEHSDKHLSKITAVVFILMLMITFYPLKSVSISDNYYDLDTLILESNAKQEPETAQYLAFKKDMNENNSDTISSYIRNKDDLISLDNNMVFSLTLIRDTIKNESIKQKFDDIYQDKYITVNEYTAFKEYVTKNASQDKQLALLVSRP